MKRINKLLLVCLFPLTVGACTSMPDPEGKPMPAMTFNHVQPLTISVQSVRTLLAEDKMFAAPEEPFIKPLPAAIENYFASKISPQGPGGLGTFTVRIQDASVEKNYVPAGREMARFLGVGGLDEYVLNADILLVLERPDIKQSVKMQAGRTIRVSEHVSIADRERNQLVALEELLKALDAEVERVLTEEFSDYIL